MHITSPVVTIKSYKYGIVIYTGNKIIYSLRYSEFCKDRTKVLSCTNASKVVGHAKAEFKSLHNVLEHQVCITCHSMSLFCQYTPNGNLLVDFTRYYLNHCLQDT